MTKTVLSNLVKERVARHPTTIVIVAAILTLFSFSVVYVEVDSMGASERAATHEIRQLENIRGQIVFYGEVLTNSTLMAAVTGNSSWSGRFLEHQDLLGEALVELAQILDRQSGLTSSAEDPTFKLLNYKYEAFELIQQNRVDEAKHMLFGMAFQQQKKRHEEAIAQIDERVDTYIENTNRQIENGLERTQRFIILTLLFILASWAFVLLLIHWWQKEIRKLAFFDPLTGLASRRYFMLHIDKSIKAAVRRGDGLTVLFMDLDGFKDVNDSMGHDVGDLLLKEIADRLTYVSRESDFVSRLGGDEFCILLEGQNVPVDVERTVERFMSAIEAPVDLGSRQFRPRTSIGIARYPRDGATAQVLMKSADSAMYCAKKSGKHRYEYYNSDQTDQAEKRLTLIGDLREAFHRNEFLLHFQPIVNLKTGRIDCVEALVRWQHPSRSLVPPLEFITQLEELGLIDKLGEWVLEQACTQVADWNYQGHPLKIAVNISSRHFLSAGFVESARNIITRTGLAPDRVILEITESAIQENTIANVNFAQLRELGIQLAIDDFGTGYSSLGSLRTMPIDILKIDQVFIKDLLNGPRESVMLSAIMEMAHGLDLQVVAEGVEGIGHVQALGSLGADLAQGFYFSGPVTADEMVTLLESGLSMVIPDEAGAAKKAA